MTTEQTAFEAWVRNTRGSPWPIALDKADAGNYLYLPAIEAWQVWQARAALDGLLYKHVESATCYCCCGTGRIVRDPDIGTDQECFYCNGEGVVNEHTN